MSKNNYLHLALAAYEGFAQGDMTPLFSILADDIRWINHSTSDYSPFKGVHHGPEGVRKYFSLMPKISQTKFQIKASAQDGDHVMVLIDRTALYKAVNKLHDGQIVHVLQFSKGKLQQMDIYEHGHF